MDLRWGGAYRFLEVLRMLYHTGFLSNPLNGCLMFKRRYAALLPALILLSACSSKPKTEAVQQTAGAPSGASSEMILRMEARISSMVGSCWGFDIGSSAAPPRVAA